MKAKDIVMFVLMVALAVVSWFLWISNLELRDREIKEARARLSINVNLYLALQQGDVENVQRHLGVIILGHTRDFERRYGAPTGTNSFVKRFATARAIAAQVETNMVPISSIFPDAKVTVKPSSE